jgi:hypothetical protein
MQCYQWIFAAIPASGKHMKNQRLKSNPNEANPTQSAAYEAVTRKAPE